MQTSKSIRRRVFTLFITFAVFLSVLFSAFSIFIAYAIEDAALERVVKLEADYITGQFQKTGQVTKPRVDYIRLYQDIADTPIAVQQVLQQSPRTTEIFTGDETHYHLQYLSLNQENNPLLLAEVSSLLIVTNMSPAILFLLLILLVLGLLLSLWLSYILAKATVRPVEELAHNVSDLKDDDNEISLAATKTDDEIGYLATAIENSLNNLKQAIKREKEFTRDVSHELRTPLTVIKNSLSLAEQRTLGNDDIVQIRSATETLERTVSTLLMLARSESIASDELSLTPVLENLVLEYHQRMDTQGFAITLDIPSDFTVSANKQLLLLLVRNLVENAVNHASVPELTITTNNNEIIFSNPASHIPNGDLAAPDIKDPASTGLGHGLYLVDRMITLLGWDSRLQFQQNEFQVVLIPAN